MTGGMSLVAAAQAAGIGSVEPSARMHVKPASDWLALAPMAAGWMHTGKGVV